MGAVYGVHFMLHPTRLKGLIMSKPIKDAISAWGLCVDMAVSPLTVPKINQKQWQPKQIGHPNGCVLFVA